MSSCTNPINLTEADICLVQGDSFIATVTVLYSDGTVPDLDGWGALAQIRIGAANWFPVTAEFELTWEPPNIYYLELDKETSRLLCYEHYVWDMQLITPDGEARFTVLQGVVNVTLAVTSYPDLFLWPRGFRPNFEVIVRRPSAKFIYAVQLQAIRSL